LVSAGHHRLPAQPNNGRSTQEQTPQPPVSFADPGWSENLSAGFFVAIWSAITLRTSLTEPPANPYTWGLSLASGGSMYAVIRTGGKQYRVEPGKTIRIERLEGKVGGKVTFDEVLAVRNDDKKFASGADIAKAKVIGKIVAQDRGPKMLTLKYKTGGQYNIKRGHRQNYTSVEVSDIQIS
jgi:large subunit ribosomal protein L21